MFVISKESRFERADGATPFFDEVGDLASVIQPKIVCAIGSWSGRSLSLAPYATGLGPTDGASAPLEGANAGHPQPRI